MFGRFWEICLRYMNTFSLCCFFLHSNFLEIISHLSHIIASPIITNLFYLFFCTVWFFFFFSVSCSHSLTVSYLSLFHVSTYFFFYFRSIYCLFRAAKSWANIYYYIPFIFFPFHWRWKNQNRRVDFCKAICTEGERQYRCRAEIKTSHSFYFSLFFGAGLFMMFLGHSVACSWSNASFL